MFYEKPMPFYMAYPVPYLFDQEKEQDRDLQVMKSFYSETAAQVQELVEQECDRMEYEGSMMYDRYPDRLMLEMLCRKIYRELNPDHIDEEGRLQVEERYFHLIQVMLMQEMYRRRCRHYRCRRWY